MGAALVACVAGLTRRPRFLVSKGGITSSDVATKALGMKRAEVSYVAQYSGYSAGVDVDSDETCVGVADGRMFGDASFGSTSPCA